MKRTPLKRRTPLHVDPEKVREFQRRARPLQRREPVREMSAAADRMRRAWGAHARRAGTCEVCGYEGPYVQGHHVIALAALDAEGVPDTYWYDLRNQMVVCCEPAPNRCHERHTLWVKRIPREKLSADSEEFAAEVGLGWLLDLQYPPTHRGGPDG